MRGPACSPAFCGPLGEDPSPHLSGTLFPLKGWGLGAWRDESAAYDMMTVDMSHRSVTVVLAPSDTNRDEQSVGDRTWGFSAHTRAPAVCPLQSLGEKSLEISQDHERDQGAI